MEIEIEPRAMPLTFKVRATSRGSPTQKAAHVLDSDLRSHWSTGTNTKEWILLELQESCLLSHVRIYNKSVLEWEISAGLRYKPETFVKARPRCEAPRREMLYPMNYMPCQFVRISCSHGNPIAIFSIQLIGVSVASLEPEFQPVIDYLLPHITAHKQDSNDMHLKLLEDITSRLQPFLPQLEPDITNFMDDAESSIRFLSLLSGQFYPLLYIVVERYYCSLLLYVNVLNWGLLLMNKQAGMDLRRGRALEGPFPNPGKFRKKGKRKVGMMESGRESIELPYATFRKDNFWWHTCFPRQLIKGLIKCLAKCLFYES